MGRVRLDGFRYVPMLTFLMCTELSGSSTAHQVGSSS